MGHNFGYGGNNFVGAVTSSGTTSLTGSFGRLQCAFNDAHATNAQYCSLSRVEWGLYAQPEASSSVTGIINTNITLTAGSYLEGPIVRFKPSAGHWIAYHGSV
tara:strand:- start:226 stop:534 length:309 start_codon:yes stop_codon:yes gene_type:complete